MKFHWIPFGVIVTMPHQTSIEHTVQDCLDVHRTDYKVAIDCLEKLFNQTTYFSDRIYILKELGHTQIVFGKLSEAEITFQRLLDLSKRGISEIGVIQSNLGLALVETKRGHAKITIAFAGKSLELSKK